MKALLATKPVELSEDLEKVLRKCLDFAARGNYGKLVVYFEARTARKTEVTVQERI